MHCKTLPLPCGSRAISRAPSSPADEATISTEAQPGNGSAQPSPESAAVPAADSELKGGSFKLLPSGEFCKADSRHTGSSERPALFLNDSLKVPKVVTRKLAER